ncbi:MAG: serine/threonine-protein kinase [Chloroflexota bacterium]
MTASQFGPYILHEPLGEGGFSRVYRAHDQRRRVDVALKLLDPAATATEEGRQRFLREVEAARRLRSRHIVPVYETGIHDNRAFLALRLMRGGTLAQRLARTPILDDPAAAQVLRHVARALDHARRYGIIHRDVKPSNIFYDANGVVCLGDFGLAKVRGLVTVTKLGQIIGSVYYMAPEQVRGLIYTSERSDVYSLGVVLYEMMTGRVPFQGQSQANVLHAIVHSPPPRPRQINSRITPEVERVILRALHKDPQRRYASAGELAAAFQQAAFPGQAPPRRIATQPRRGEGPTTAQRPEFWVAVLGLLGLLLLILFLAS